MSTKNDFLATTGHFSKAWNAPRGELLGFELRNSRFDVLNAIADYLSSGYSIYDIPAEGGLTYLSAKTAGKYLCVWKTCAPAYLATPVTGTAATGTNNTTHITLASGASAVDNYYVGMTIQFTGGTGSGQYNIITGYVGSTRIATVTAAWPTAPVAGSTMYKIGGGDTITTADVSIHTNVIVTSCKLQVSQYSQIKSAVYNLTTGDYASKLTFKFSKLLNFTVTSTTITGVIFEDSELINPCCQMLDANLTNLKISITDNALYSKFYVKSNGANITIKNIYFFCTAYRAADFTLDAQPGKTIAVSNVLIENYGLQEAGAERAFALMGGGTITLDNVGTIQQFTYVETGTNAIGQIVYADAFRNSSDFVGNNGIVFRQIHLDRQQFVSQLVSQYWIDTAGIMTDSNFDSLDALISTSLENIRGTGYQYSRRYYQLSFQDSNIVSEDFKTMFAREQSLLVIWRDDLDETFVTEAGGARTIRNLLLCEHDGTTAYDYRNNENFFLLAEDSGGNEAVFSWYQGMIFPTAFTDFWDNTVYTIKRCFQLLEPPDKLTWRNKINGMLDSPIECSAQFQDMTSMYVDKR